MKSENFIYIWFGKYWGDWPRKTFSRGKDSGKTDILLGWSKPERELSKKKGSYSNARVREGGEKTSIGKKRENTIFQKELCSKKKPPRQ